LTTPLPKRTIGPVPRGTLLVIVFALGLWAVLPAVLDPFTPIAAIPRTTSQQQRPSDDQPLVLGSAVDGVRGVVSESRWKSSSLHAAIVSIKHEPVRVACSAIDVSAIDSDPTPARLTDTPLRI
jgi:hypothetical protein